MKEVNENDFDNIVLKSNKLVLVDLWTEWCRPCGMVTPILEEISKEYSEKITVVKCNVDDNPTIAAKYGIRNIPTVLYFKNGNLIDKQVGAFPKGSYINKINMLIL
jgi:thioredoxin 1